MSFFKNHWLTIFSATLVFISACCVFTLMGCQKWRQEKRDVFYRLDGLYKVYLTGNIGEAKESMFKAIELLSSDGKITEAQRAHGLGMAYSRLFCVARAEDDRDGAQFAFAKAKSFFSKQLEIQGISNDERKRLSDELTEEILVREMSEKDLLNTGGRGPKYEKKASADDPSR